MPQTPHIERHFTGSDTVRDIVIGMSDGLTVPFALAAGLSGVVGTTFRSAGTIAGAYVAGGFVPLFPYFIFQTAQTALIVSVIATLITLGIFGYIKGHFTGAPPLRSAFQTVLIGGLAAGAAFLIARAIS